MTTAAVNPKRTPRTRAGVVREAGRDLLLGTLGWAVGAAIIWRFGTGTVSEDLGLMALAVVVSVAVVVLVISVVRREMPRLSFGDNAPTGETTAIWGLILAATAPAILEPARALTEAWSTLQVWSALFLFVSIGVLVQAVPRFVRPDGWTGVGSDAPRFVSISLLILALAFAAATAAAGEKMVQSGRIVSQACDTSLPADICSSVQPARPIIGDWWYVVGGVALGAIVGFAAGLTNVAFGAVALLYFALAFWFQQVWAQIMERVLFVDDPVGLLALQIEAAIGLVIAAAVIQIFKPKELSPTAERFSEWVRPEDGWASRSH